MQRSHSLSSCGSLLGERSPKDPEVSGGETRHTLGKFTEQAVALAQNVGGSLCLPCDLLNSSNRSLRPQRWEGGRAFSPLRPQHHDIPQTGS